MKTLPYIPASVLFKGFDGLRETLSNTNGFTFGDHQHSLVHFHRIASFLEDDAEHSQYLEWLLTVDRYPPETLIDLET